MLSHVIHRCKNKHFLHFFYYFY